VPSLATPSALATGRLDAEPGKNPGDRPREHYWDRQPHGSAKQCRMNLSGDDDIRDQRERGGNQHGPLAWIVGIGDCDLIHGVEVTGACRCWDARLWRRITPRRTGRASSGGYPKAGVRAPHPAVAGLVTWGHTVSTTGGAREEPHRESGWRRKEACAAFRFDRSDHLRRQVSRADAPMNSAAEATPGTLPAH
jgi:hypothetical protein